MTPTIENLNELYGDTKTCARLVGLDYVESGAEGLRRVRHGKGFTYRDALDRAIADKKLKQRITELVIPPAWQEVWICPTGKGHVLATGIDEKGRKQYIYHPKWRTMRDLIKFYRMIIFGKSLPAIRAAIDTHLQTAKLDRDKVLAVMLWILDNAYIRIGNDVYFNENESVGLTTLTDTNVVIAGPVVTLSFKAKSGKDQQITFEHKAIADILEQLKQVRGARLFRFKDTDGAWKHIEADNINTYLHDLTGVHISAKDFRTWGGTLVAFLRLIEEDLAERSKPEKAILEAVDKAAAVLGNTRGVARASYVHPHILDMYGSREFRKFYEKSHARRRLTGLDKPESDLLYFLEELFEEEFTMLRQA
jgi:DNA topoisomerase-1